MDKNRLGVLFFWVIFTRIIVTSTKTTVDLYGTGASSNLVLGYLWRSTFEKGRDSYINSDLKYVPVDSLRGIEEMQKPVNETDYAYGASDAIMTEQQYADGPDLAMTPVVGSPVAVCFNLPGIFDLNLTREAIVGIYNGTYTWWNDSVLVGLNPQATLPQQKILVIARADYSGTTEIFTTSLSSFSSAWNDTYGSFPDGTDDGTGDKWNGSAVSLYGRQSRGVIGVLFTYKYSIGYLSIADAVFANFSYAKIYNKFGNLVVPTVAAGKAVMNETIGQMTTNLTAVMVDSPLPGAYPIYGYTYFIIHLYAMPDCTLAVELQRYLLWIMKDPAAQDQANDFFMSTLTSGVDDLVQTNIIEKMTCNNGENVWLLTQRQIDAELKSSQKWRIPVFVVTPIVLLIILILVGQNLWQKMMIRRAQLSDEWLVPFSAVDIKWDGEHGWIGKSRAFGSNITSTTTNSFMSQPRFMWSGLVDMLGLWNDKKVGLAHFPLDNFHVDRRETKIIINTLRVTILHTNVQRFFGVTYHEDRWYLIREHAEKGSITDVLQNSKYELDANFKFVMALDVSHGMEFLHSQEIVHGQLNSTCCLLDARWNVKISNWEIKEMLRSEQITRSQSKVYPSEAEDEEAQDPNVISRGQVWLAPELIRNPHMETNKTTDVYSYGILLVEIFSRQDPYQEYLDFHEPTQLIQDILDKGIRPAVEDVEPVSVTSVMVDCWDEHPNDRPTFAALSKRINHVRPSKKSVIESMMDTLEGYVSHLEDMVQDRTAELAAVNSSLEMLLHQILPPSVAKSLSEGTTVQPEEYESVTVFFSDIVRFTDLSARSKPMDVVNLLNDLYTCFDAIIERLEVYKIDTIGDAYMVISGLPIRNGIAHAGHIATMAIQLMEAVGTFKVRHLPGEKLQMRGGFHSGSVVAGVVGKKMPRYTLFGDTVNVASRMESNSVPMKTQTTESSYRLLNQIGGYIVTQRGEIEIKGKGKMKTYWVEGKVDTTPITKTTETEGKAVVPTTVDVKPMAPQKNAKSL